MRFCKIPFSPVGILQVLHFENFLKNGKNEEWNFNNVSKWINLIIF